MASTFIFESIEQVDAIPTNNHQKTIHDIFPYVMRPCDDHETYPDFIDELEVSIENYANEKSDSETSVNYELPRQIIDENIKCIYIHIDYPLTNPAIFKFTTKEPVTYGMLLYTYTIAYQMIYIIEEEEVGNIGNIPGMLNRKTSNGKFGIWGHHIGDLVYNGSSTIVICKDFVACDFSVDS